MDVFTEALSVVPLIHLESKPGQRVLLVGPGAGAAVEAVLRYPTTASVLVVGQQFTISDKRVQFMQRIEQVPPDWKADLALVAVPALSDPLIATVRARTVADVGVVVFAIAAQNQVRRIRETIKKQWPVTQAYREHIPGQPQAAWFVMASDRGFKRHRLIPSWTQRMSDKYLPSLFTFAKDECVEAFGQYQAYGN